MEEYHEKEIICSFCGEKVLKHRYNKEEVGLHIVSWADGIEGTELICTVEECETNHRCKDVDINGL
jgi:hypothetical protein